MVKYLKTAFFIVAYTFIYVVLMFICQIAFGLTIGGAGGGLLELLTAAEPIEQNRIFEAVDNAWIIIDDFVLKNNNVLLSISALLSILIFIKIFSARKLNLFEAIGMDRRPVGADMRYGAFAGASANFVISMVVAVLQNFHLFDGAFAQYDAYMESSIGSDNIVLSILGIGLVAPLVEEILFRGMIVFDLERSFSRKTAIIAQGVIFGLYHIIPVQIIYAIPLGIYLGYIVYKSGSIWPAIAGHIAMNTIGVLMSTPGVISVLGLPSFSLFLIIGSVYMFISALRYFIRKKPSNSLPNQ